MNFYTYIPPSKLPNLYQRKHKGDAPSDLSFIAKTMQPLWDKTVKFIPIWMAPNTVTLLGYVAVLLSFITTIYFSPDSDTELDSWIYIFNAFCVLFFQTTNAIDEKQAQRTDSGSALDELFDHAVNAMAVVLLTMEINCVLRVGRSFLFFLNILLILIPFYLSEWEFYWTGNKLLWYCNVTEAQLFFVIVNLIATALGSDIFKSTDMMEDYTLGQLLLAVCYLPILGSSISSIVRVYRHVKAIKVSNPGKFNETLQKVFKSLIPFLVTVAGFSTWAYFSPIFFEKNHYMLCSTLGLVFCYISGRTVLARIGGMDFDIWYFVLIPVVFALISSVLLSFEYKIFNEDSFVTFYFFYALASYIHFAYSVWEEMTNYLGVNCFSLKKWAQKKRSF